MLVKVDGSEFPNVHMRLCGVIESKECIERFKQIWMMGYAVYTSPFTYIIDTTEYEADTKDMKYINSLASFFNNITKERKNDQRYTNLVKSIIIVDSPISKQLLTAIMSIAATICPIHIVGSKEECSKYM